MSDHLLTIFLAFTPAITPAEDAEAFVKEFPRFVKDVTDVLPSIKDQKNAEAALPKLKTLDERWLVLQQKRTAFQKLSADEQKKLESRYGDAAETALKSLKCELDRLDKLPDVKALLKKQSEFLKEMYEILEFLE